MGELLDALKDLLDNIKERGLTLFTVGSALIVVFKFLEGIRKKRIEDEMYRDLQEIKRRIGVEEWKTGPPSVYQAALMSFGQSFRLFSADIYPAVLKLRRRKEMNQQVNWVSIVTAMAGAGKIILQSFGIEIPQEQINEAINGAAAVVTIIGIFMSHRKEAGANVAVSKHTTNDGPAV